MFQDTKYTQYLEQVHGHVLSKMQQAYNKNKLTQEETKLLTNTFWRLMVISL